MAAKYIAVQALLPFIAMQLKLEHQRHFITTHAHLYSHFQTYLPWKFCGDISETIH